MKEFKSFDEVLEFAINAEQEAVDFYTGLASHAKNDHMRKVFTDFAQEEMRHKSKLLGVKENRTFQISGARITDLKIAEYLGADMAPTLDMTYQDALVLAMKKEKNAFRLYSLLAEESAVAEMKELFLALAQEESKHKLRFEVEYDDVILREN
jgi:rubrerythrin